MKIQLSLALLAFSGTAPVAYGKLLRGLVGNDAFFASPFDSDKLASSQAIRSLVADDPECGQQDIDVCIAVDRSGSICAPPGSSTYSCRDKDPCTCLNWESAVDFTNAFIGGAGGNATDTEQRFALVGFSSTARSVASLANANDAIDAMNNDMTYTSGWTNTGGALKACRELLAESPPDKKRAIVLISDGSPTRPDSDGSGYPYNEAKTAATTEANLAKEDDISIIGVFVNTTSGASSFLETLASPGTYLEVTDFADLETVSESLVGLVQCPPPPPPPTPAPTMPARTCEKKGMDVCIAIDRSGSVCAPPGGPYPDCSGGKDCSCGAWDDSIAFVDDFIMGTDDDSTDEKKFALVGFASQVEVEYPFASSFELRENLGNVRYTGGWTNTGDAIKQCNDLLKDSTAEKTIILVTDGSPTRPNESAQKWPYNEARDYAMAQADVAKEDGATIVGVFVETSTGTTSFLEQLASPGFHMAISSFEDLDEVSTDLVDLVKCEDPTDEPSSYPSSAPSIQPSELPSASPSASPTCRAKDLDVCIAIDRSGSICRQPDGSYLRCWELDLCTCDNWEASKNFTEFFVEGTLDFPGQQQFAIVGFGNNATTDTTLMSTANALDSLAELEYTGGYTHTSQALQRCREALKDSEKETAIVLVTDGIPTRPNNKDEAKVAATAEAEAIKLEDETTLITVSVKTTPYTSRYLESLATEGYNLDVSNFENLENVSGRISALLSCASS